MLIKRRTTERHARARGRVTFRAAPDAILHAGAVAAPGDPASLLAPGHKGYDRRGTPEVVVTLPGIGEVVLMPGEVAALEAAIEQARAHVVRGDNFNGRELSRSF